MIGVVQQGAGWPAGEKELPLQTQSRVLHPLTDGGEKYLSSPVNPLRLHNNSLLPEIVELFIPPCYHNVTILFIQ